MLASRGHNRRSHRPRDWCDMCKCLYELPLLARVTWVNEKGDEAEGGVVCSQCWRELQGYFDERSSVWAPLFRSL